MARATANRCPSITAPPLRQANKTEGGKALDASRAASPILRSASSLARSPCGGMKQPAASPGRAEKPQQLPAPPGLARLLLSKSRRGARSRRAPATSPMFVSRGRSRAAAAAGADGEPSSPKVTCIGQVRMRKGKKGSNKGAPAAAPPPPVKEEKARGYCRCLKKAFLCGGLFDFDRKHRRKGPAPEAERTRRSPWVFSSRDVAVAAAPKPPDPASDRAEEEGEEEDDKSVGAFGSVERDEKASEPGTDSGSKEEEGSEEGEEAELVSSATTTPPKNALLLMRCRSAPQNRSSPLTTRFAAGAAPSPVQEMAADFAVESIAATPPRASPSPRKPDMMSPWASPSPRKPDMVSPWASPSPRKPDMVSPWASPSRRKPDMLQSPRASSSPRKPDMVAVESSDEKRQEMAVSTQEDEEKMLGQEHEVDDDVEEEEDEAEEMRCSSARPLVLQRCKSEPATTAAAKMAAGAGAEGAPSGCFWANGGSSGRRRHAPQMSPAAAAPVALTGH